MEGTDIGRRQDVSGFAGTVASLMRGVLLVVSLSACQRGAFSLGGAEKKELPMADFVQDGKVTDDDLRVAEALRDDLFRIWLDAVTPEDPSMTLISVDDYINELYQGRWPNSSSGWSIADCGKNPRSLIRVSQLGERHVTEQCGGKWRIVSENVALCC